MKFFSNPFCPTFILFLSLFINASLQSTPDYLLLIGPTPVSQKTITLPVSQFTSTKYSLSFWFKINKAYSQKLLVHDYSISTVTGQALNIIYTANRSYINLLSISLPINPQAWNFVYIGVDCSAKLIYSTTIIAGVDYNEALTLNSTNYTNNTCFGNTLTSLSLTVGDSTLATQNMGNFSNFRYFPSTLVTQTSVMRQYISQEIDPWLWLRFPPSEVDQAVQKLRDYARGNLVLKGYGYNSEASDSAIVMAPNSNYTYGNAFTDATYTTAYVDYLGPSFTLTFWVALDPQNADTTERTIAKIDDNNYPRKSQLSLGLSPVDPSTLQYSFFLQIANETNQVTFLNTSNIIQFATSSDPNITEWLLVVFKLIQSNDLTPNFFSWEIFDRTGTLRTSYKSNAIIAFTGDDPILYLGGFNGYLTDVRTYKGTGATLTSADTQLATLFPNCTVAIGALYLNLTVSSSNTAITSSLTCLSCTAGFYSALEVPQCSSTCYTSFEADPTTNLCKCSSGDCLTELTCDSTCRRCNGISRENCRTCTSNLYLSPSPHSCGATCPTNYCPVYDLTKGGVCILCEQFNSGASLTVINGTFVELQFTNNMNITGNLSDLVSVRMVEYAQPTDYEVTFQKISNKSYYMIFTYHKSLPLRALKVTFNSPTTLLDENGYHLSTSSALITADLPSIFSPTPEQIERNDLYRAWALYIIYFMVACFPILLYTGDLGIFWGLIDSAQVLNYLLYINFTLPTNVSNFLSTLSFANLQFFPNLIWELIVLLVDPLDLEDQGAPENFVNNGVLYVSFLYNSGRVLSIFVIIGVIYLVVAIVYSIDFETEERKAFVKKVRSWVLFMAIRMFLVGFLQVVFAVILQIYYPSYKDVFSMISVVLAMVFGVLVVWMPINLIVSIEKMRKTQLLSNFQSTSYSYLKSVIREYRQDYLISRNFVFFLLLRNIALVIVLIFVSDYPLTQSGAFLNVSLLVSLWIAAMPIYNYSSYTIINLVTLVGFGVIGIIVFWMIGNNTFNDPALLAEYNYDIGEIMEVTSLVILFMYSLHVVFQVLRIGWQYWIKFLNAREKKRKEEKSRIELELATDNSKSKLSLLESSRSRSARGTRLNDSLLSQDITSRHSRKINSRIELDLKD